MIIIFPVRKLNKHLTTRQISEFIIQKRWRRRKKLSREYELLFILTKVNSRLLEQKRKPKPLLTKKIERNIRCRFLSDFEIVKRHSSKQVMSANVLKCFYILGSEIEKKKKNKKKKIWIGSQIHKSFVVNTILVFHIYIQTHNRARYRTTTQN